MGKKEEKGVGQGLQHRSTGRDWTAQETWIPSLREDSLEVDSQYFTEANLFLMKDRATLTFYVDQEVHSIHYDKNRDEIFYKGHNIKNILLTDEQWLYLQQFSTVLLQHPLAAGIQKNYQKRLESLLSERGVSS